PPTIGKRVLEVAGVAAADESGYVRVAVRRHEQRLTGGLVLEPGEPGGRGPGPLGLAGAALGQREDIGEQRGIACTGDGVVLREARAGPGQGRGARRRAAGRSLRRLGLTRGGAGGGACRADEIAEPPAAREALSEGRGLRAGAGMLPWLVEQRLV